MSFRDLQTVIKGEASETDDEEEMYVTSMPVSTSTSACGVKIQGEASETDEEEEEDSPKDRSDLAPRNLEKELPPLVVIRNEGEGPPVTLEEKPLVNIQQPGRYSTLLQQKLLESNARLYHDVNNTVRQVYHTTTTEIRALTSQLNNSQNGIINASHNIRLALEDLKGVSEKIDIITSCNLLPDIRI